MDLYHGSLSVLEICNEIKLFINCSLLVNKELYIKYILENGGYCKIPLSDGSEWVLRRGPDPERYVHIHPARNSSNTTRIKANTLKSLIAVHIIHKDQVGLTEINQVRTEILQLGPLTKSSPGNRIGKHLNLFDRLSLSASTGHETTAI